MNDSTSMTALGMIIGFALGAGFMAWMGAEDARALFFRRKRPRPGVPEKLIDRVTGADMKDVSPDRGNNFASGVLNCPICQGFGVVEFLRGSAPCPCIKGEVAPEDAITADLTLEQSREIAARVRGKSLEPYVTVDIHDIVKPKMRAKMIEKGVEKIHVTAQIAADITGKAFKLPEQPMRAVYHEEGDPQLLDDFGHCLEGRGPLTIRTYGPQTGRLSCAGNNFKPREDEITVHDFSPDETEERCPDSSLFPDDSELVDEFGTVKGVGPDEPESITEVVEAINDTTHGDGLHVCDGCPNNLDDCFPETQTRCTMKADVLARNESATR